MSGHLDSEGLGQSQAHSVYNDDVSLIDIAVALARHKKLIILIPLLTALLTALLTFFIPSTYTATIKIQPSSDKLSKEAFVSLLKGDDMNDSLVQRFMPRDVDRRVSSIQLRRKLLKAISANVGSDGLIYVNVDDPNPVRAARITNAIPAILRSLVKSYALTEGGRRRELLQSQLPEIEKAVVDAEKQVTQTRSANGFVEPEARVRDLVRKTTEIKARIAMKELELVAMGPFDPAKNQNYTKTQQDLSDLWMSLGKADLDPVILAGVSEKQRAYLTSLRDVVYHQTRYDQLLKQIEIAMLEESKDTPMIQVLGKSATPEEPSEPKRGLIIVVSTIISGFIAVLWALISDAVSRAEKESRNAVSIRELKRALTWKNG